MPCYDLHQVTSCRNTSMFDRMELVPSTSPWVSQIVLMLTHVLVKSITFLNCSFKITDLEDSFTHIHARTHAHTRTHALTHARTHAHTHTHTHTHTCLLYTSDAADER